MPQKKNKGLGRGLDALFTEGSAQNSWRSVETNYRSNRNRNFQTRKQTDADKKPDQICNQLQIIRFFNLRQSFFLPVCFA